jgi:hypothetical protein
VTGLFALQHNGTGGTRAAIAAALRCCSPRAPMRRANTPVLAQ